MKTSKKILVVLAVLLAVTLFVSAPLFAGGSLKDIGKKIEKIFQLTPSQTNSLKQAGADTAISWIKRPTKKANAKVETSVRAEYRATMNQVDRSDSFQRITFRSQGEAIAYWNDWYEKQLSTVYNAFWKSYSENPSRRGEFKQIRDEDIRELRNQRDEELGRYGNTPVLTNVPSQL